MRDEYIEQLTKNLPVLRASTGLTQVKLAELLGVSRQTIVAIENHKRPLPWSLYLAMLFLFEQFDESDILLDKLDLFSKALFSNRL